MVKHFGLFLLEREYIDKEILLKALTIQEEKNFKFGEVCLEKGWLTPESLEELYEEQKKADLKLGEIAIRKGLLTEEQLKELLRFQEENFVDLSSIIIDHSFMNEEALSMAKKSYEEILAQDSPNRNHFPKDLPYPDLFSDIVEQSKAMLTRMLQTRFLIYQCKKANHPLPSYPGYTVFMRFNGVPSFDMNLCASSVMTNLLIQRFWGILQPDITEEFRRDGLAEIHNIITGSLVATLSDRGVGLEIGLPKVNKDILSWTDFQKKYFFNCNFLAASGMLDILFGIDLT